MFSIRTKNGGSVDIEISRSPLNGTKVWIHIDESVNIKNGEGEAATLLSIPECKDVIYALNEAIKIVDGVDYVYTSESVIKLISTPEIQNVLVELGYDKMLPDAEHVLEEIKEEIKKEK